MPATWPVDKAYAAIHIEDIPDLEPRMEHRHAAVRVFKPTPQTTLLTSDVKTRADQGRLPIISNRIKGKWFEAAQGLNGFDTWWRTQIRSFVNSSVRVIFLPTPEPDSKDETALYGRYGQTDARNADDFNAMVNHMQDLVEAEQATDWVRLCACTTGGNIVADWARRYMQNRAHYIGADPYNWCAAHGYGDKTDSFAKICEPIKQCGKQFNKPVVIAEVATYPAQQLPFIAGINATLGRWPRCKVVSWFHRNVECDFRLTTAGLAAWDGQVLGGTNVAAL